VRSAGDFGLQDEAVSDSIHVVAPSGEVDLITSPTLARRLLALVDEGKTHLVVDLSKVTFMDSTGIGVLLNAVRRLGRHKGRLVLVCPTDRILRPFEISGLVGYLPIFGSREEALGAVAA
jgi:anti-sigma B factor antagonist